MPAIESLVGEGRLQHARRRLRVSGHNPRMSEEALLEAVRGLRVAEPDLGFKPLLAKLREQQPDLGAATKEVRVALAALTAEGEAAKADSEAAKAAAVAPPAAEESGTPSNVALSLACIGCARVPSDMDDEREKHPICESAVIRSCRRRTSAA